jgi:hypothetical protein
MNRHPYLRAYMAGILLPTWVLLVIVFLYLLGHAMRSIPSGLERAIIFPMAVVPNVWGVWNVLYLSLHLKNRVSIGIFGAILPLLLVPVGIWVASALDVSFYTASRAAIALPVILVIYFLMWKYAVAYFNRVVDVP